MDFGLYTSWLFFKSGKGVFLNRGEPSMALKVILVPHYIYGNISPGGVLYTLNY